MGIAVFKLCGTKIGVLQDDCIQLDDSDRKWIIHDGCVYDGKPGVDFIGHLHGDCITSMTGDCLYTLKEPLPNAF